MWNIWLKNLIVAVVGPFSCCSCCCSRCCSVLRFFLSRSCFCCSYFDNWSLIYPNRCVCHDDDNDDDMTMTMPMTTTTVMIEEQRHCGGGNGYYNILQQRWWPFLWVLAGSPSRGGDVVVYVFHINQPSLPTPWYSVLVSVSVFMALSIVFHSIHSPDNSPLSHSVLPILFLPYWSFQVYTSLWKSPSALI